MLLWNSVGKHVIEQSGRVTHLSAHDRNHYAEEALVCVQTGYVVSVDNYGVIIVVPLGLLTAFIADALRNEGVDILKDLLDMHWNRFSRT